MATATFFVYPCIDFVLLAFVIGFVGAFCCYTVAHRLHKNLKIFHQFFLNFVQVPFYFLPFAGHAGIHMRMMRARCNFLFFPATRKIGLVCSYIWLMVILRMLVAFTL